VFAAGLAGAGLTGATPLVLAANPAAAGAGMDDLLSRPMVLVVALAVVSLVPLAFMSVTAFVKISTVLQIVRSAIGAQSVPSTAVVTALAAILTVVAMAPVGDKIAARAGPLLSAKETDTVTLVRAGIDAVREPLREFLKANADENERERFFDVARRARTRGVGGAGPGGSGTGGGGVTGGGSSEEVGPDDLTVVLPAFVVTQLGQAFAVGFLIYLPFLVIDLVVSNLLLALGMQMMTPTQVSLPFKLLLFVGIDGWGLLAKALVEGYR
jgi:type III secretion protein R